MNEGHDEAGNSGPGSTDDSNVPKFCIRRPKIFVHYRRKKNERKEEDSATVDGQKLKATRNKANA